MHDDDRTPAWRRYLHFWRPNATADVRDELAFHLESAVEELVAAGVAPDDARRQATERFGDVDGIRSTLYTLSEERERTMRRTEWLDTIRQDLVFGLRQLRKTPGLTLTAITTLALGIGATSAMFSVVYSVLLRPLPYANTERVLQLSQRNGRDTMWNVPFGNYETWKRDARGFEAIGATWGGGQYTLTGAGEPTPVVTRMASAGYWKAMFVPPVLGHYFTEAEDRFGAPPVAVLSLALWQNRYGGDRNIVGKPITLEGRTYTVVGVAPADYILQPPAEQIWIPLAPPPSRFTDFGDHELLIYGLLKPGVAPAAAIKQLADVERPLAQEHPHSGYDGGVIGRRLDDFMLGQFRSGLYMMLGAVALVLLIACGNIANLLLARATARRTEMAVRSALGASRRRIVAQLLVESAVLGLTGALLGLAVAAAGVRFLVNGPVHMPRLHEASLNVPVATFTLALALVCTAAFGLVPAIRMTRLDLQQTLRDGGRDSRGTGRDQLRYALVVGELCVTQVLLIGAGLLIRSSLALQAVPVGFNTHNVLALSVSLPGKRYAEPGRMEAAFVQMEQTIAAIPGVASAARAQIAPIYGNGWNWTAMREGSDGHDDGSTIADMRFVSADYFKTLELPLLRGRAFTAADGPRAPLVAIVSRNLAKRLWGDADPIGHRISNGGKRWREVIGVADDMHSNGLRDEAPQVLYLPTTQQENGGYTFLIRGKVPVTSLVPEIRRAIGTIDPLVAPSNVSTIDESLGRLLATERFTRWLLMLLAGVGLLLAIVGVYGVVGYFVAQRTREIGVRIALGATSSTVRWMVARQGLVMAAAGLVVGVPLSLAGARLLREMIFGVTLHDPVTVGCVAGLLGVVVVAASYLPARRATRIDPLEALRSN
jgi:predicted permease